MLLVVQWLLVSYFLKRKYKTHPNYCDIGQIEALYSSMQSCLYECRVMHHRLAPKEHKFSYRIYVFALDLDEIDTCTKHLTLFSHNRWNIYSFYDSDYVPTQENLHNPTGDELKPQSLNEQLPLKERIYQYLTDNNVSCHGGKIILVTVPRIFGYAFNPVSFYYCYNQAGEPVAALAEVTNTFREMKLYFINKSSDLSKLRFRAHIPKNFYVSPFSKVDLSFDFDLCLPDKAFAVKIDDYDGSVKMLESTMAGPRRELTNGRLFWWLFKYPLMTLRIISLIHIHALKLYFKKIPWFKKTAAAEMQQNLYRPHHSINRQ